MRSGTLREVGDAQHGHVVQRVKVVCRDAALAQRLMVGISSRRKPSLGDHAAEVRVGVVQGLR